jgi:hypothetical protein
VEQIGNGAELSSSTYDYWEIYAETMVSLWLIYAESMVSLWLTMDNLW